jgi:hypothetical protein
MSDKKTIYIISDNPEENNALSFGFEGYARTLTKIIASKNNKTPLTIGVYGK